MQLNQLDWLVVAISLIVCFLPAVFSRCSATT
jgi:hypothetical protein